MAERLRGGNVLLQMYRTAQAVRRPAFGDLWPAHLRGTTAWRFRVE